MSHLRDFVYKKDLFCKDLSPNETFSVFYHNIFDYPLNFPELIKWTPHNPPTVKVDVDCKNGFYFVRNRSGLVYKHLVRERISQKKIKIASNASKIIALVPTVKMVGITGSLAMKNASKGSDIDLIIITKEGKLWLTRIMTYMVLKLMNFKVRKPGKKERGELCLNIWLDQSNLKWGSKERNFFTAHEILQIIPLVDKDHIYEHFLSENKWALDFWPNAIEIKPKTNSLKYTKQFKFNVLETLAFKFQALYMKGKITRETVGPTRAIFHPNDLSKKILNKLGY